LEGNTSEAEDLFDEILESDVLKNSRPLFEQAGIYRLMIKTAIRLSRWNEALVWAHAVGKRIPWHQTIKTLYLTTLVRGLEYGEISKHIDIRVHSPEETISLLDVNEEFDWLSQNTNPDELQERWLMRGSLAYHPTQENIKAFALLKPLPEDAAAIIAALRKVGQISTALQLGKKYPGEPAVLNQIALCQSEKDLDASITTLDSVIGMKNTNPVALRLRAEYHKKAGHSDLAVNDLESALLLWQNEFTWHKTAAELWVKLGNDVKAVQHWQFAFDNSPEDFDAGLNLGKGFVAIGENEKAVLLLQELTKNNPNQADLWETLTDAYLAEGNTYDALESARKANELNPFSVKPYLLQAKANLDEGNIEGALFQVEKADQQVKNNADVKIFMAKLLFQKGDKAAALAALEDATRCKDLSPKTILEEIKLIREINGSASAKNLIEYFSQQMPENVDLLTMLAESQLENGEARAAELTARRALKITPDSLKLLIFIGKEQVKKGQLDQAIHSFSQVIKLHSDYLEAYYLLGEVYEKQREYSKAIDILKQVVDQKPGDIQAYVILAGLYKNAKNYRLAEEMLKRAVNLDPKNVAVKRQLGALLALNLVHQSQEVSSQL
jgi:tetratricopeptide (TPR) repeat protein